MAVRLSEVERKYFLRKLNEDLPSTTPLNDIKTRYWRVFLGGYNATSSFNDMRQAWMTKVIGAAGGDSDDQNWGDMWRNMVLAIGQVPVLSATANMMIFYINAP